LPLPKEDAHGNQDKANDSNASLYLVDGYMRWALLAAEEWLANKVCMWLCVTVTATLHR